MKIAKVKIAEVKMAAEVDRVPWWVAPAFAGAAVITIPWIVFLGFTLPPTERIYDRTAWVGFDIGLVIMLSLTAFLAWRRRPSVALAATATATLLVVDAWFDVLTSRHGIDRDTALVLSVIELAVAAGCVWTATRVWGRR